MVRILGPTLALTQIIIHPAPCSAARRWSSVTISQKDEIPRFQIGFHFIRMGRSNDYFALAEDSILISYDYFTAYRIGDTAETGLGP